MSQQNKFTGSGKKNPCPVCDRTNKDSCRIIEDGAFVLCHTEVNSRPLKDELRGYIYVGTTECETWGKWVLKDENFVKQRPVGEQFRYP